MDTARMGQVVGIVGLVAFAGAAAFFYTRSAPAISNPDRLPNPALAGVLVSSGSQSVTVELAGGGKRTFSVSGDTRITTVVAAGEAGKTLAQLEPGTRVYVQPRSPGSMEAAQISAAAAPMQDNDSRGPAQSITGTILATTTTSITLKVGEAEQRIMLNGDTKILSGALAGQLGKALSDAPAGTYVQVEAVAAQGGPVARSVQLMLMVQ